MSCPHVVFMNLLGTGHINPTLPLVAELKARGCAVSYFVNACMQDVVESAGAVWHPLRYPHSAETGPLKTLDEAGIAKYVPEGTLVEAYQPMPHSLLYTADVVLPALIEDMQMLDPPPSIIVYDPFLVYPRVAGHVLKIPAVTLFTMPGPGVLIKNETVISNWESKPWVRGPRRNILDRYGFDVLRDNLQMESYSPVLNLVTTIEEFFAPPPEGIQRERYGHFPFQCIGALVDAKVKRVANVELKASEQVEDSLLHEIDAAKSAGRQVVYISMGTVATGKFWHVPFGFFGKGNGLEDCDGKTLIQHVFNAALEAVGNDNGVLLVISTGPQDDVFDAMPELPANLLVRQAVPQLEVLQRCDVFITHGGANSMHEALSSKVPMLVVPVFGDQPLNADAIAKCGAGIAFRNPLDSVTPAALRRAIGLVTKSNRHDDNEFRAAVAAVSEKLSLAGGVHAAANAIIEHIQPVRGTQIEHEDSEPQRAIDVVLQVGENGNVHDLTRKGKMQATTVMPMSANARKVAGA